MGNWATRVAQGTNWSTASVLGQPGIGLLLAREWLPGQTYMRTKGHRTPLGSHSRRHLELTNLLHQHSSAATALELAQESIIYALESPEPGPGATMKGYFSAKVSAPS